VGNIRDLLDRQPVELGAEHDRRAGRRAREHRRDAMAAQACDDPVGSGRLERAPHGPRGRRLPPRELGLAMQGASPRDELGDVDIGQEHGCLPDGSAARRPVRPVHRWQPTTRTTGIVRPSSSSCSKRASMPPRSPIDRRLFWLDDAQWQAFRDVLDRPVIKKPRLARLLAEKSVLE
jgi:hypothetical protein